MNDEKQDILEELEQTMIEEIRVYKDTNSVITQGRINRTDRIVKSANVILAIENLKERKYMNRTQRKAEIRRVNETVNNNGGVKE